MLSRPAFERVPPARADRVRAALHRALGPSKLLTTDEGLLRYAGDASEQEPVAPDVVVLASCPDDIAATLRIASEHEVPVTPRGAGSGKSGGAVPVCGGIALCTLGMRAIEEIDRDELLAVVQPGIILADLYEAVEAEGLMYPPDPNSWTMCALGGTIAENAAGPRSFKYGKTRDHVLGLEVITAAGTKLSVGRRTAKGVTGYDLTGLLVGSEGTLAVTTRATVRLCRKPEHIVTLMGLFGTVHDSARAVASVVAAGLSPRCLELIDGACLAAMRDGGVAVPAASGGEQVGAMLIMEVDGDVAACERTMEAVGERVMDTGALDVLVAQDAAQRERLWRSRRELSEVTRRMARFKISEDVVVPRGRMAELIDDVMRISDRTGIRMLNYGHAGDGNLHVNLLWSDESEAAGVQAALDALFRRVVEMQGTLSGEHGIGTSKAEFMPLEQSPELLELQRRIKAVFDPKGVLNPGKIFPRRGHGAC